MTLVPVASAAPVSPFRSSPPEEIRGIHLTGPLMTLTGKLDSYLAMKKDGLNTIELDLKDESGNVTFTKGAPAIAKQDGAALRYFDPSEVVGKVHKAGMYLIGSVVTFEDPITVQGPPGARDPPQRRLALAHERRPRLAQSLLADGVEVRRRRRRCRGEGRLRRDPVRLRPLPERRRPLDHPLPGQARRSRWTRRSRPSSATRRSACTRSASASPPTSSASRRRTTSESASIPARSARWSTPSTR